MVDNDSSLQEPSLRKPDPKVFSFWWPLMVVVSVVAFLLIFYLSIRGHEHVSPGKFVGPHKCKECHEKQFASWKQTRMANSFEVLRAGAKAKEKQLAGLDPSMDYTHSSECLPCHTTGYGRSGGFVSIEKTPDMAGVTCEACHGDGGGYVGTVMNPTQPFFRTAEARKAGLVYPPTENVCRECHNAHSPFVGIEYKFDFDERVKRGTHEHFQLKYEHKS